MDKIPVTQITESQSSVLESYIPPEDKLYVRLIEGRFQTLRRVVSWPMILMFFALAWVQVDGQPWLFFSFAERKIFLFGLTLSWHDLPIMAGMMIAGACLLFFMAVAWGRVWCGFACPQSVWTWMFIRIEEWAEGKANQRVKNDQLPLKGKRLARRVLKHVLWLAAALFTTITFTGYFIPIRELISDLVMMESSLLVLGWLVSMAALTYLNAGLVREQICLHACPYSRFQAVMFDSDTSTVSYDLNRGEPRRLNRKAERSSAAKQWGKQEEWNKQVTAKTGMENQTVNSQQASQVQPQGVQLQAHTAFDDNLIATSTSSESSSCSPEKKTGDCIDCSICVQVCPVGIDIRDGLQAACIDCGACIDACDEVMVKIGKPIGLIRFASEEELAGGKKKVGIRGLMRPKLAGYATVMACSVVAVLLGFMNTLDLLVEIRRDRLELFTRVDNHTVCNKYNLKVESFDSAIEAVSVSVAGLDNLKLHGEANIDIKENNSAWRSYRVCAPDGAQQARTEIQFIFSTPGSEVRKKTTFLTSSI